MTFLAAGDVGRVITEVHGQACDEMLAGRPMVAYECLQLPGRPQFTFVSNNVSKLLGYTATDFCGDDFDWLALIHPDDRQAIAKVLNNNETSELKTFRYRVRHQSGDYCWVQDDRRVVQRAEIAVVLGSWLDISEQESLRSELKQAQAFTRELLGAIAEPIFIKDANHLYTHVNQSFCDLIRQEAEGICGKSDYDIFA